MPGVRIEDTLWASAGDHLNIAAEHGQTGQRCFRHHASDKGHQRKDLQIWLWSAVISSVLLHAGNLRNIVFPAYKQVPGTVRHNINVEGTHVGAGRQETSAGDISEILRKRSLTSRECRLPASPAPKPTETQLSMMRLGRVDYLPSKPPADWFRHLRQKETSGQSERERDKPMERSGTSGST
ncbi:hypothetical protein FB45DRAFT_1009017 [Roridomyces roridus]|uniref:Uncharacterized protein n=1 Tax=Roridomyces roridus TaxID=1738132 RepID=A0AAD7FBA8_9AGAR|nr:hypothetical protein FB45DRAFT_1009017 [Roridomyces roridus]